MINKEENFKWGVSASSLQTEGAYTADGKGQCIWGEFALRKNKIRNQDNPFAATDFYHRYAEDIAIIESLGIPNFRLSISWSRILPNGTGEINQAGIDYYHKVFDECRKRNIEPWVTLYHWDLPNVLQQKGGWANREILSWFEEYVKICVQEFRCKVTYWMVLNEPMVFTGAGYFLGVHAPGKKKLSSFLAAMHHAVLCQSIGYNTIKKIHPNAIVGTTYSCSYITPNTVHTKDALACKRMDALLNRCFIEPTLGLGYPLEDLPFLKRIKKYTKEGDDELMKVPFDFIGIQNYTREVVRYNMLIPFLYASIIPADKRKVYYTAMDWEVYPEAIYAMIKKYSTYDGVKKIIVTENGASFPDQVIADIVQDDNRIGFLREYIAQVERAQKENLKVEGYFAWALTDNFEWAEGYKQRFGLVHIDFNTQKRTIKQSGYWYARLLKGKLNENTSKAHSITL